MGPVQLQSCTTVVRSSVFPNPIACQQQHSLLACLPKCSVPSIANLSATKSLRSIQQSLQRSNSEVHSDPQNSVLVVSEFGPKLATLPGQAQVSATIHPNQTSSTSRQVRSTSCCCCFLLIGLSLCEFHLSQFLCSWSSVRSTPRISSEHLLPSFR